MGEVYRATDTVLKRQVALKVLPRDVADDPERVTRFQREAEVLASLNHPNIAHLYGLERSDGTLALVMELVEGPTLADQRFYSAVSEPVSSRVLAAGGEPQVVVPDEDSGWPVFLPGGGKFLYLRRNETGATELRWRDLETKSDRVVREVSSRGVYAAGQVLFSLGGALMAQRFDPSAGTVSGDVVQVASDLWSSGGRAAFTASSSGMLAYRVGQGSGAVAQVSWLIERAMW